MKIIIRKADPNDPLVRAFAEPMSLECEIEYYKLIAVEELLQFMKREGINRSELAERMGVGPSRITAMLSGDSNLTIDTLVRAAHSVGAELNISFQPAVKTKASEEPISKVAEEPTPYRTASTPKAQKASAAKKTEKKAAKKKPTKKKN
jgi:plasmid maintenance system antidote protein VapI